MMVVAIRIEPISGLLVDKNSCDVLCEIFHQFGMRTFDE